MTFNAINNKKQIVQSFISQYRLALVYLLFILAFALPEIYVHWHYAQWINEKSIGKILVFVVLGCMCALTLHNALGRVIALSLWWLQGSQVMHHQFFQRFYNGADVALSFVEAHDIAQAMLGMWRITLSTLLLGVFCVAMLVAAMCIAKPNRLSPWAMALMLVLLSAHTVNHAKKSVWKSEPGFAQLAVHNGLNSHITYWEHFAFREQVLPSEVFEPYQIEALNNSIKPNIILVIGESINPHHLSVLAYERETTPQLLKLLQEFPSDKKVIYSAGVTTRVSTPMLLALNREPKHIARYKTRVGQLVSEAKNAGYHTELYSSQTLDFMPAVSAMTDYDVFEDRAQNRQLTDELMPEHLNRLPRVDKPRLVILNIRSPHMPYAEHIKTVQFSAVKTGDNIQDLRNEYDDAMLAADTLLAESIRALLRNDPRPTLIVLTSDHGQALGEKGRFGHNRLELAVAEVPLLAVMANWPNAAMLPSIECVNNHYQLGVLLLNVMGLQLHNPNDDGLTYYINGNSLYGNNGDLSYQVNKCQK